MTTTPRRRLGRRLHDERGFTLIELLVVILLIAILASIALTTFLGKKDRGEDANAKSNARNLVTHVEACFTVEEDYANCDQSSELPPTGIDYGTGPGQVSAEATGTNSYVVTARSTATDGGAHVFTITRPSLNAAMERRCTPVGKGGCPQSGIWEVE